MILDRRPERSEWHRDEGPREGERRPSIGEPPRPYRRDSPPRSEYVYDAEEWAQREKPPFDRPMPRRSPPNDRFYPNRPEEPMRRPIPGAYGPIDLSPPRDLRDANQRTLERLSIERRHEAITRDLESVKQRRETLDSVYIYDERDDERAQRERSLERLKSREEELRDREKELAVRERALREALRQSSPPRRRPPDDSHMRRGPDDRPYPPGGRYRSPPRGRGSPGRDYDRQREFREREDRGRGRRRSPSPRRE